MTTHASPLQRREVDGQILRERADSLVVASLGNPCYDVMAHGDRPDNFYLWGAMGGSVALALGLALAQPRRRVLAFVGDGELMMGLGSLATVAVQKLSNLSIVVIDNEHYAETGMQRAHTGRGVDLSAVARAVGFKQAHMVRTAAELEQQVPLLVRNSPGELVLVTVKVGTESVPMALPPRDGPYLRSRFRQHLLGESAHA